MQRIDDGSYGICEVYTDDPEKCECPESPLIPEERLLEVPNATKGVFCKGEEKTKIYYEFFYSLFHCFIDQISKNLFIKAWICISIRFNPDY